MHPSLIQSHSSLRAEVVDTWHVARNEFLLSHVDLYKADRLFRDLSDKISARSLVNCEGYCDGLVGIFFPGLFSPVDQVSKEGSVQFSRGFLFLSDVVFKAGKEFSPDFVMLLGVQEHELLISIYVDPVVVVSAEVRRPRLTGGGHSVEPDHLVLVNS